MKFRLKLTEVSPDAIDTSVAIVVEPRTSSAQPPVACPAAMVALLVMFVLSANKVLATTVPPEGVTTRFVGALGATVSIRIAFVEPREPLAPGLTRLNTASLPEESLIRPPLRASAPLD